MGGKFTVIVKRMVGVPAMTSRVIVGAGRRS